MVTGMKVKEKDGDVRAMWMEVCTMACGRKEIIMVLAQKYNQEIKNILVNFLMIIEMAMVKSVMKMEVLI